MKLQKKIICVLLVLTIMVTPLVSCNKDDNYILEGADIKDNFVELMFFNGEKTKCRVAEHGKEEKLYDEISGTKLRQISLKKVSEFKTPCFGARFITEEGVVDITCCDGMLLRGVAKRLETAEKSSIKHEYELYEADFDFMNAFDKYAQESIAVGDNLLGSGYGFEDVVGGDEEEDEEDEDFNVFWGGARVANSELLCKYNNEFYGEVKTEIPKERDGVCATNAEVDRNLYVQVRLENETNYDIDIEDKRIQKKIGDKWYDLPTESLYESTHTRRYLWAFKKTTLDVPLEQYGELESGKYRAVIDYSLDLENSYNEDDDCRQVACEFEIK